jgi:hypothetical protein
MNARWSGVVSKCCPIGGATPGVSFDFREVVAGADTMRVGRGVGVGDGRVEGMGITDSSPTKVFSVDKLGRGGSDFENTVSWLCYFKNLA